MYETWSDERYCAGWEGGLEEMTEEEFRGKLSDMFNRLNKSIKIIRDQITENQSAPFLANLSLLLLFDSSL